MKFKVGDKVQLIDDRDWLKKGDKGVVTRINPRNSSEIGVEWKRENMSGHDCGGTCKNDHGWYVFESQIKKINGNLDNNMVKKYRLLKDSFELKAGAIVKYDDDEDDEYVPVDDSHLWFPKDQDVDSIYINRCLVEKQPDWFEPIVTVELPKGQAKQVLEFIATLKK